MTNLEYNLFSKHKLRFHDGRFKILCISDLHGVADYDTRVIRDLKAILDNVSPDFVFVLGDMVWRDCEESPEKMRSFVDDFFGVLDERKIPWGMTYGNHDSNRHWKFDQSPLYFEKEYCCNKQSPTEVFGDSNYVLPVYNEKGDDILFNIWSVDTHDSLGDYCKDHNIPYETKWEKECAYPLSLRSQAGGYDTIRFDQVMWYYNTSLEIEKYAGHRVPGLVGMHMCIPEYNLIYQNPAHGYFDGNMRETCGNSPLNSGFLACMLDRGDIKTVVSGHDHINDYTGKLYGITLTYDGGLNYDGYCADDMRGGRVFELREGDLDNIKTYMVRAADLVPGYPGVCKRKSEV